MYVGLGVVAPDESNRWLRSIISIGCFCLGSAFFSNFHRLLTPRRRWVLVSSFTIQMIFTMIAALMVTHGPKTSPDGPMEVWVGVPLALIAFQSAGQAVTSRVVQYNGLTSVVLTSIYCDLFSDQRLFSAGLGQNPERNRRIVAPLMLLIGAIFGGLFAHSSAGFVGALWTVVAMKAVAVVAWSLWPADPEQHE